MPTEKGPRHRALSGLSNSHELPFSGSLPETSSNLPTGKALTRLCISTIWPQPFLFACVMNTISLGLSHIRLGTMADLAIIVCSSYNYSHFYQSKRVQKMNFQWNCYKKLPSRISPGSPIYCKPLLQQKKGKDYSNRLLVFTPMVFLFWSCILMQIILRLTDKISLHRIYWLVIIGW